MYNHLKKKKIDLTLYDTLPPVIYEEEIEVTYDTGKIFKGIELLPPPWVNLCTHL